MRKNIIYRAISNLMIMASITVYSYSAIASNVNVEYAKQDVSYESIVVKVDVAHKQDKQLIFDDIKSHVISHFHQYEESDFFYYDVPEESQSALGLYLNVLLHDDNITDYQHINEIIESLQNVNHIDLIYPEPIPSPIDDGGFQILRSNRNNTTSTLDYEPLQDYLKAADNKRSGYAVGGVDAYYAWGFSGGDGTGITVVQKEIDQWNEDHKDLPASVMQFQGSKDGEHGTASMGIMGGIKNGYGVTGISHNASFGRAGSTFQNFPQIIEALQSGDVVQIGIQVARGAIAGCTSDCFQPMESSDTWFNFIKELTDKGVHVIQAAGNGGLNLDHPDFKGKYNRNVRDSGANLVGAVCAKNNNTASFSNYGSRIDSASWGCWDVVTTGYSSLSNTANDNYTSTYSGTSSANPIVAGATASLSGVAKEYGIDMTVKELRQLLTDTGTPVGSANKYIATQPNLRTAIDKLIEGYWDVQSLTYDYLSSRVSFSFNNRYSDDNNFYVRLTHNGEYAASCKMHSCYYSYTSNNNGIKTVYRHLNLNVGDTLKVVIYDGNTVLAQREITVTDEESTIPDWTIDNLWYDDGSKRPYVSFNNHYSSQKNFYIKLMVNGSYIASCAKATCYYSRSRVSDGVKTIYRNRQLKSGDVLQATIHYGSKSGTVIDKKTITIN